VKPRVGISRCLLGDAVRYDGTDKRADDLLRDLADEVEWVPVCPEVDVGMGTPREPIQIVGLRRLVGVHSGKDWTDAMQTWAHGRVRELLALQLSGYIFKARSPSCGIGPTVGLFAEAVMQGLPQLPVVDEDELTTAAARAAFLKRVRAYAWHVPHQ
jgi:uncharacterized protein YbbK (DUF523 family)